MVLFVDVLFVLFIDVDFYFSLTVRSFQLIREDYMMILVANLLKLRKN